MVDENLLILVDGHALIYRAYHAFPGLTDPDGQLVNAVFGFFRIMLNVIEEYQPKYLAVAFDSPQKTFRHADFEAYKAHRAEMPDDLKPQISKIKDLVRILAWPQFEVGGFEADDVIGTLSRQLPEGELQALIVTGDKDILQLVTDRVTVWMPARGEHGEEVTYTPEEVRERMGVTPEQIIELKALMGDASDNIPGVKGVGKKTAAALIQAYGSIDAVYDRVHELTANPDIKDPLIKGALLPKLQVDEENARLSRKLATISLDAPVTLDLGRCEVSGYNKEEATEAFMELGFKSLIKVLPDDDFEKGLQAALF